MHDYPRVCMSLFLRLCIWSYVAFVRVAGLSCSIRTVDREIRLSLPSREVGTRRKLNEKKKKKKATNRNLYDIFFFFFERISISFGTWQRSIRRKDFCENCDYEDVFKKIFSRWIINLVEERVLVSRVKFFYYKFRKSDTRWKHTKTQRFFVYLKFHRCR